MEIANAVLMAQRFIGPKLTASSLVIDATAGNGKDTLFMASNIPSTSMVWAFDIQQQALNETQQLLARFGLEHKVRLVLDNHAHIPDYISQPVGAAMFNLGYLPGGDHTVSTCPDTTIEAINHTIQLLQAGGVITVVTYPGYAPGRLEDQAVHKYLAGLNQSQLAVACWSMVNQKNNPPILYIIEKIGSE